MASGQTANYGLNQWAAEDRVLREEFNQDNAKIDGAIQRAAQGNCRILIGTYLGNGGIGSRKKVNLTFPFRPLAVLVAGGGFRGTSLFLRPHKTAIACDTGGTGAVLSVEWGETSLSWYATERVSGNATSTVNTAEEQLNMSGKTYTYLLIGEV